MNTVGIDVSKGKSMVAVMQPLGVVAAKPFEVVHTAEGLENLGYFLKGFPGETRIDYNPYIFIIPFIRAKANTLSEFIKRFIPHFF